MRSRQSLLKILVYHHIEQREIVTFKRQVDLIAKLYGFITPEDLPYFFNGTYKRNGIKVLLTFDDGFKSNLSVAQEILAPLDIRAIFFVCPNLLSMTNREQQKDFISTNMYNGRIKTKNIPDSFIPMGWGDLNVLLSKGHTIGAHTMNHCRLSEIVSENELQYEIIESGNQLEKNLGVEIQHFAFPFGNINSIDRNAMRIIRERYKFCYSAIRGINNPMTNPHALLRDPVSPRNPLGYYQILIENGIKCIYNKQASTLKTHLLYASTNIDCK